VFYYPNFGFIQLSNYSCENLKKSLGYFHNIRFQLITPWRLKNLFENIFPSVLFILFLNNYWNKITRFALCPILLLFALPFILTSLIFTRLFPPINLWKPQKNDILIIPDLSWSNRNAFSKIDEIKRQGAYITTLIHDTIPLSHPHFCDDKVANNFTHNFPDVIKKSDLIIANSKFTKRQIGKYNQKYRLKSDLSIKHFYLGADIDIKNNLFEKRQQLKAFFSNNKVCLSVGTIEPRKNYAFLINSFQKIWDYDPKIKLIIVGRYGWKSDVLKKELELNNLTKNNLIWLDNLTDDELLYCYKKANLFIYPSIIEGFGLPLIEALYNRCPVLASDIPIFREIGGNHCKYFSLDDADSLTMSVINFFSRNITISKQEDIELESFTWPNWEESSLCFFNKIKNHFEQIT
jgi:alpha-1,2-rhamnosyltransferase